MNIGGHGNLNHQDNKEYIMDLESDFIFDDICDSVFPAIQWMLEECDDIREEDIPRYITEDENISLEQAHKIYEAYKINNE